MIFCNKMLNFLLYRLDCLKNYAARSATIFDVPNEVFQCIQKAHSLIELIQSEGAMRRPDLVFIGERGRPSYNISREKLLFFIENRFTITDIASMCGVSERTIKRRLQQFNVSILSSYSNLTDEQLQEIIKGILDEFPNCGYKKMTGFLSSCGFRV